MKSSCRLARSKSRSSMTIACSAASPPSTRRLRAGGEELVVAAPVDRLDHLHRDQLVEPAPQVTPVLAEHRDPIGQPRLRDLLVGVGESGGSEIVVVVTMAAVALRRPQGERAPARRRSRARRSPGCRSSFGTEPVDLARPGHLPASPPGDRRRHRNRSSSRRATAAKNSSTGRSAPGCSRVVARLGARQPGRGVGPGHPEGPTEAVGRAISGRIGKRAL